MKMGKQIIPHAGRYGRHGKMPSRDMDGGAFQCGCACCNGACLACDDLWMRFAARVQAERDTLREEGVLS